MKVTEIILHEDIEGHKAQRAQFIKKTYGPQWDGKVARKVADHNAGEGEAAFRRVKRVGLDGYPREEDFDRFIAKLAEVDPTQKGIYMAWLANMCLRDDNNRPEDLDRVGEDLKVFDEHKNELQVKDINGYKTFQDLYDAIAQFSGEPVIDPEEAAAAAEEAKLRSQIVDVYKGPEGWIKVPTTQESATWLGRNTRWCTAGQNGNQFNSYNSTDRLFVVYDKASKSRFQLHINSGQFADAADRNVGLDKVPAWARGPIVKWYGANVTDPTPRQVVRLIKFGNGEVGNLNVSQPVEDLLNLMRREKVLPPKK